MDLRVFSAATNLIGESPVWSVNEQALYWVDVEGKAAFRQGWSEATPQRWPLPEATGCCGLRKGGLVLGMRTGFATLDTATGAVTPIHDPEADKPDNRFNDGKVDRRGRFFAGTKNIANKPDPTGAIWRLDPDRSAARVDEGISCVNGIAWSPDDRLMYACDTWRRLLFAYDYDPAEGRPSNRRLFATLPEADGYPDGLTVDAEGFVWNAHYDGWRITRYAPDGRIDRVIRLPVRHVTSLVFGGPDLDTLLVTSASLRLTPGDRAGQPLAGHVFALQPCVKGMPEPMFGG